KRSTDWRPASPPAPAPAVSPRDSAQTRRTPDSTLSAPPRRSARLLPESDERIQVQQGADGRSAERVGVRLVQGLSFGAERLDEEIPDGVLLSLGSGVDDENVNRDAAPTGLGGLEDLPAGGHRLALGLFALRQPFLQLVQHRLEIGGLVSLDEVENNAG